MKFILSRKGFDYQCGGHPSPVLDGTMLSLPIPEYDSKHKNINSGCRYSQLELNNFPVNDFPCYCHLDPDIRPELYKKKDMPKDWCPTLGQCGAAASHLRNQHVAKGDVFLFFGLFRQWCSESKDFYGRSFHAIWGYMQIEEIIDLQHDADARSRFPWHPHLCFMDGAKEHSPNLLFIGNEKLSFAPKHRGYGTFHFNDELQLTITDETRVTHWRYEALPWIDRRNPSKHPMTYHSEQSCNNIGYFQSACRGQEFVIPEEKSDIVTRHLKTLLELK